MKIRVNKAFFLGQVLPIVDFERISLAAYGRVLSGASFGNTENFRVPAEVAVPGQVFLTADEWRTVVKKVQDSKNTMVDIEL
ncbi:MAG TPA: hypothetical protein PKA28_11585 [Methylomusa anaerophila]|uniref:Uncharacterized protein n=1 Tax=Methylomusa anaerophila TaxID=1930071 RepID=A0A348AFM9_9FIRM|nr:hypothetical protein [Methylomusa anaerophila]BBB89877.1 hypothetical protein MAMMFC1_00517 [Methylomusa anaerophila]HML89076.1 hypothetical protein [Methylomusa anaerophila]